MAKPEKPQPDRPYMPGYGLSDDPPDSEKYSWSRAVEQLAKSRNYWISTTRPDGRPHAMPVWGLWLDDTFLFSTGPNSVKGRNLAANPYLVMHTESGDDVVVLEGVAEAVTDPALRARFSDEYNIKYNYRPDPNDLTQPVYALRLQLAFTWQESDFVESATRWKF